MTLGATQDAKRRISVRSALSAIRCAGSLMSDTGKS